MSTWYNDDLDVKFRLKHRAPVFISGGDVPSGRDPELTWLVVMTKVMTLMTSHPESLTRSVTRTTLGPGSSQLSYSPNSVFFLSRKAHQKINAKTEAEVKCIILVRKQSKYNPHDRRIYLLQDSR